MVEETSSATPPTLKEEEEEKEEEKQQQQKAKEEETKETEEETKQSKDEEEKEENKESTTETTTTTSKDATTTTKAAAPTTSVKKKQVPKQQQREKRNICFIHLDLGIGGAESLILHLAQASLYSCDKDNLAIFTTRCDTNHCYDAFSKSKQGTLSNNVFVVGSFIPATIFGLGQALMSNIRYLYLTCYIIWMYRYYYRLFSLTTNKTPPDVIVVDVLPLPLPILQYFLPTTSILFYCHFPDQLLVQNNNNNDDSSKGLYRQLVDQIEDTTIQYADLLVANSKFTKQTIQRVFPSLSPDNTTNSNHAIRILYPTLDLKEDESIRRADTKAGEHKKQLTPYMYIVSLNRYERKKNIELLLQAYRKYLDRLENDAKRQAIRSKVKLMIAGGYDTLVKENVEYHQELQELCQTSLNLNVKQNLSFGGDDTWDVQFLQNISDQERTQLLQRAICLVYTPHEEHFGIVPLEAMYMETCVVACQSGGPTETILDQQTGYLCQAAAAEGDNKAEEKNKNKTKKKKKDYVESFSMALEKVITDPFHAIAMGWAGRRHVLRNFNKTKFQTEWELLLRETVQNGNRRRRQQQMSLLTKMKALMYEILSFAVVGFLLYDKFVNRNVQNKRMMQDGSAGGDTTTTMPADSYYHDMKKEL